MINVNCEFYDEEKSFSDEMVDILKNSLVTAVNSCIKPEFNISLNITAVSGEEIHRLNKEMRDTDRVTDVLSFPMLEFSEPCKLLNELMPWDYDPEDESVFMGDIILCKDKISEQAIEYGHTFLRESVYLTIHGLLHLFGYDHMIEEDKKIMREKEKEILSILKTDNKM